MKDIYAKCFDLFIIGSSFENIILKNSQQLAKSIMITKQRSKLIIIESHNKIKMQNIFLNSKDNKIKHSKYVFHHTMPIQIIDIMLIYDNFNY